MTFQRPGYATVTSGLNLTEPDKFVDWAKRALGAELKMRFATPDGVARHIEIKIGDTIIAVDQATRDPATTQAIHHVYVADPDAAFARAVEAGSTVKMPVADMFYGERTGMVTDPFGNHWGLSKFLREVPPEELMKGAQEMMARMGVK